MRPARLPWDRCALNASASTATARARSLCSMATCATRTRARATPHPPTDGARLGQAVFKVGACRREVALLQADVAEHPDHLRAVTGRGPAKFAGDVQGFLRPGTCTRIVALPKRQL